MFGKRNSETLVDRIVFSDKSSAIMSFKENTQFQTKIKPILVCIFAHYNGDDRPYVRVNVLGISMSGLLDTGANRSFINNKTWSILSQLRLTMR